MFSLNFKKKQLLLDNSIYKRYIYTQASVYDSSERNKCVIQIQSEFGGGRGITFEDRREQRTMQKNN